MESPQGARGRVEENYAVFRDCLSSIVLQTTAASSNESPKKVARSRKRTKPSAKNRTPVRPDSAVPESHLQKEADELSEFIEYLAGAIFDALPGVLQQLDHRLWRESKDLQARFTPPLRAEDLSTPDLPLSIPETLVTYHLVAADPTVDAPLPATTEDFLVPILTSYVETLTTPPPSSWASRTDACEICERDWIPLSYHHLMPRFVHEKVVKRGWHRKEDLQNVAWLCGACHRLVHQFKTHEELARDYYTVDLLLAEEDVRKFAAWLGRLRWKGGKARPRAK